MGRLWWCRGIGWSGLRPSPPRAPPAGLTKVPIDGQPASIVQELDDMARQYIKGDNAIILAVTPANADLATSDALRMAREVGPVLRAGGRVGRHGRGRWWWAGAVVCGTAAMALRCLGQEQ